jgi:hypothetical protein
MGQFRNNTDERGRLGLEAWWGQAAGDVSPRQRGREIQADRDIVERMQFDMEQ